MGAIAVLTIVLGWEIIIHKTAVHYTGSKYLYYSAILTTGFQGFKDTDERMEYTFVKDS